jgi:hypothetical protein
VALSGSPALQSSESGSRRSAVLADLDISSQFSLGPTNFFSRRKAVREALVQSITRRKERNQVGSNSLFLFSNNQNHVNNASSTKETLQNESDFSTNEIGESISEFIKLGVQISSSWLQDELKISPTAKKRFEIYRNPTPVLIDDPATPQSGTNLIVTYFPRFFSAYTRSMLIYSRIGSLQHQEELNESSELKVLADSESSDIKLFNVPFSATDFLRKQGIPIDGSQVYRYIML